MSITHDNLQMSELVEIVDSLENKISKLLHKLELLNLANRRLEEEIDANIKTISGNTQYTTEDRSLLTAYSIQAFESDAIKRMKIE